MAVTPVLLVSSGILHAPEGAGRREGEPLRPVPGRQQRLQPTEAGGQAAGRDL